MRGMNWGSRLLCVIALVLHAAAPVSAYVFTAAGPDFGALCSVLRPLSPESPNAPVHVPTGHPAGSHVLHCPLCGGAMGAALPAPPVPLLAVLAGHAAPAILVAVSAPDVVHLAPRARGPPLPA
jgi:hypothetical protein